MTKEHIVPIYMHYRLEVSLFTYDQSFMTPARVKRLFRPLKYVLIVAQPSHESRKSKATSSFAIQLETGQGEQQQDEDEAL